MLVACSTTNSGTPCAIAAPERTLTDKNVLLSVQTELSASVVKAANLSQAQWRNRFEETYQTVKDQDASCLMLLRTVACLSEQGRSDAQISEFRTYLKETHSCERTDEAKLVVDSVVQQIPAPGNLTSNPPIAIDIFVRNSGDKPAQISVVKVWFDENLRSSRGLASVVELTEIYAVTVDSTGAIVAGAKSQMRSPAKAWYPSDDPVLIVETPVAQVLGPRSTDRFRVTYTFLDGMKNRGPREQVRVVVFYNSNRSAESKVISLAPSDTCVPLQVRGADGALKNRSICR